MDAYVRQMEIMNAVHRERDHQRLMGKPQDHAVRDWLRIMRKEMVEAEEGLRLSSTGRQHPLYEVLQVVALGVACLEQHGLDFNGRVE